MEFVTGFASSNIQQFGYDEKTELLQIKFLTGTSYVYEKVPKNVFEEMKQAESKGKFFHKYVRGQFLTTKLEDGE